MFGIIKEAMGFRRFRLRGREGVELEWVLVCLSYNRKRLFTLKNQAVRRQNEGKNPRNPGKADESSVVDTENTD